MRKNKILKLVSKEFEVSKKAIKSKSRYAPLPRIRHIICYLYLKHTKLSLTTIGHIINIDHSTVIYGKKNIENLINYNFKQDSLLIEKIKKVEKIIMKKNHKTINNDNIIKFETNKWELTGVINLSKKQ